jgi:hypothetical protein
VTHSLGILHISSGPQERFDIETRFQWMPFRGMWYDVKRRLPLYASDWTLAFHKRNIYRVSASTIRMYFIK